MPKPWSGKRTSYNHPKTIDYTGAFAMGCKTKKTYASERIANREVEKQREITGLPFRSYRCDFCKDWHITKKPKL